jgi:ubiquinone/menaquinone biosynthesis C-methylase UbiE
MNEFASRNPTGRFSGLAETYDRFRPDYPVALWEFVRQLFPSHPTVDAVDVGCGTGISTRQIVALGWSVTGVEPNSEMRRYAESRTPAGPRIRYREGTGESTGLPSQCTDIVVAAQAFHWFRADEALREFQRILRPGGWVALMWNDREIQDAITAAFEAVVRAVSPEKAVAESSQSATGDAILVHPLFEAAVRHEFPHLQSLDRDGLLGRAYSISFGPRDEPGRERFGSAMRDLFDRFAQNGRVALHYRTVLYLARARRL